MVRVLRVLTKYYDVLWRIDARITVAMKNTMMLMVIRVTVAMMNLDSDADV